jgi:hypothetical protein
MMLSVYRQGRARSELDHNACIELAATSDDAELITFSFLNNKPALVGLNGGTAVVKPQEPGDEVLSFEKLFDTAVSGHEFGRLQRHNVRVPEQLGDRLYEMDIVLEVEFHPRARFRLRAKNQPAAQAKLRAMLKADHPFLQRLWEEFCQQIVTSNDISMSFSGWQCVDDPAPADAPDWDFGPIDDGEPDAKAEHKSD